jgi:hypothetical protein
MGAAQTTAFILNDSGATAYHSETYTCSSAPETGGPRGWSVHDRPTRYEPAGPLRGPPSPFPLGVIPGCSPLSDPVAMASFLPLPLSSALK